MDNCTKGIRENGESIKLELRNGKRVKNILETQLHEAKKDLVETKNRRQEKIRKLTEKIEKQDKKRIEAKKEIEFLRRVGEERSDSIIEIIRKVQESEREIEGLEEELEKFNDFKLIKESREKKN